MNVTKSDKGWTITVQGLMSDTAAGEIMFLAAPDQVRLGEFVEVADAEGIRIGHVSRATLLQRFLRPDAVQVEISLM